MRIAMVTVDVRPVGAYQKDTPIGPAVHVTELAAELAGEGHDVRVYARRCSPSQPDRLDHPNGYTVVNVPVGRPELLLPKDQLSYPRPFGEYLAQSWCDGWSPDVVHAHGWAGGVAALTARKEHGRPTVLTLHSIGAEPTGTAGAFRASMERATGAMADAVVALSRAEARDLRRIGVHPRRLTVAPSGVDSALFAPTGRAWARKPDVHRVLAVGQLVEHNGFADIVGALGDLPDTEVVIVGRPTPPSNGLGPEATRLRAIAVNNRVHQRLRLAGGVPYPDMPGWYRSADLLVCAPQCTPFGRSAVEAMACGIPVVAMAVGGLRDTVLDGVTGQLIPPASAGTLARVVRGLLTDAALRRRYGLAGVDRARRHYGWSTAAQAVTEVYEKVRRFTRSGRLPRPSIAAA